MQFMFKGRPFPGFNGSAADVYYKNNTSVKEELDEINDSLAKTLRYDADTDMIQIYYNGAWTDWKSAMLQFDGTIFENGEFASGFSIGEAVSAASGIRCSGGITINGTSLYLEQPTGSTPCSCSSYINGLIDFSKYTNISFVYDGDSYNFNISAYNQSGYLFFENRDNGSWYQHVFLCSNNTGYANDSLIAYFNFGNVANRSHAISKIKLS